MTAIYSALYVPFGFLFRIFFNFIPDYGIALFLFALFFRLILVPTSVKQQRGSAKTTRMQPKIKRIQQKYAHIEPANERQAKVQAETQELYQREGYSPMAGGCLPLLIQMPILIGIYGIVRQPLTYVLQISSEAIDALSEAAASLGFISDSTLYAETGIITNIEAIAENFPNLVSQYSDVFATIGDFGYKIFGINLGDIPSTDTIWNFFSATNAQRMLLLIPLLSFLTSMSTALLTQRRQKKANPNAENQQMMGCMTLTMPLMSLWFTFQFPAGMGMYWILSNSFAFIQTFVLGKIYAPGKVMARDMVEETIYRRSYEKTKK
ncbi:MAG: membrane protein insertase YidC [Clostridia bacterium]